MIAMSRCHEMLPLLETSENLVDHRYLSVKHWETFAFCDLCYGDAEVELFSTGMVPAGPCTEKSY